MKMLLIKSISEGKLKILSNNLKRLGVDYKVVVDMEMEDIALSYLITQADKSELVSKEKILGKLKF
jgi:hypothetical protein